jgi:hypothetical protein
MTRKMLLGIIAILVAIGILTSCGAPAPATMEPNAAEIPEAPAPPADAASASKSQGQESAAVQESGAIIYRTGDESNSSLSSPRLIIKNAQLTLQVEDTDTSIDRLMQIAGDVGGYVISSRVWYQPAGEENYKYATISIGVPAEQFEQAMRRLRGLALKVLDETSTGEDVTDQYVDLQSRLQSLQATRARILEFLAQAKTVDEALKVNQELASVEQQIEEVQGRINYLSGRSSFSTINIDLQPKIPDLTPTPTPTKTPTPTPQLWNPQNTFNSATFTLKVFYQGLVDLLIWIVVVLLPLALPFALIGWVIWLIMKRRKGSPPGTGPSNS